MEFTEPLLRLAEDSNYNEFLQDELWVDKFNNAITFNITKNGLFTLRNEDIEKLISVLSQHLETL